MPSYPAVLFIYQQDGRFVQAEATTRHSIGFEKRAEKKKEKKKGYGASIEMSVCAEVGILLTKKTRLTSEMSTSQASETG